MVRAKPTDGVKAKDVALPKESPKTKGGRPPGRVNKSGAITKPSRVQPGRNVKIIAPAPATNSTSAGPSGKRPGGAGKGGRSRPLVKKNGAGAEAGVSGDSSEEDEREDNESSEDSAAGTGKEENLKDDKETGGSSGAKGKAKAKGKGGQGGSRARK